MFMDIRSLSSYNQYREYMSAGTDYITLHYSHLADALIQSDVH